MILGVYISGLNAQNTGYVLVIHGGAGTITSERYLPAKQAEYNQALTDALGAGEEILAAGGSALDAVVAAIQLMEANPLFNSGKGAVFNAEGRNELDASIMDGKSGKAGAVAGVTTIKSPVEAARRVMDSSAHVLLAGRGAEDFALRQGLDIVDPSYFYTDESWQEYLNVKERMEREGRKGTVGAVALDKAGNLAAATSTGGMVFKKYGRIGDSPIIGAGTYADNKSCAVSCTGHGEYFIRNVVAYDVAARMLYLGESLKQASDYIVNNKLAAQNAAGGLIAVDKDGNIAMPFNTPGMFRGYVTEGKPIQVLMFR
ncbi:isoaspartyl peptidase/L-asparaginase [Lentimicrobium sp.]